MEREPLPMTPERWRATSRYLVDVFGQEDAALIELRRVAVDAGLPDIAISADVGRLISLLTSMAGAKVALELGTLGGYSATWIARALAPGGRLYTVELEPRHADVAEAHFVRAGVADRVELIRGAALEVLPKLLARIGSPVDLVFVDAVKTEYPEYWRIAREHLRLGGLFIADNAIGSSRWWIDLQGHPDRDAVDRMNRAVAADPSFEAACVPIREGVMVARRVRG
jgi:caffeoyl-CoA O-methyltransferase